MQPSAQFDQKGHCFGEFNEENKPHGRGIIIHYHGGLVIGYFENGDWNTGNYINIWSNGDFSVGECYLKDGWRQFRGTKYHTNGTEEK